MRMLNLIMRQSQTTNPEGTQMTKSQAVIQLLIVDRDVTKTVAGYEKAKRALRVLELTDRKEILMCLGFDFLIEGSK